jgi:hypothetical protein
MRPIVIIGAAAAAWLLWFLYTHPEGPKTEIRFDIPSPDTNQDFLITATAPKLL